MVTLERKWLIYRSNRGREGSSGSMQVQNEDTEIYSTYLSSLQAVLQPFTPWDMWPQFTHLQLGLTVFLICIQKLKQSIYLTDIINKHIIIYIDAKNQLTNTQSLKYLFNYVFKFSWKL